MPESSQSPLVPHISHSSVMDVASLIHSEPTGEPCGTLKRRASSTFDDVGEGSSRKRLKDASENVADAQPEEEEQPQVDGQALVDELEQELQCGCCSALVYRPVIVSPCQHFFCGRWEFHSDSCTKDAFY